jgi:glycosyltransferase involved in cell wall biosynthesis
LIRSVGFVYPNSRRQLAEDVAAGVGADSFLLGQNHLHDFGYEAFIHEPRLTAGGGTGGLRHRILWNSREIVLPWELGEADVVFTSLVNVLPLVARLRGGPRIVVFDFALATVLDRSGAFRRGMLSASIRSADAIVSLSHDQRDRLLARVRLNPERVSVCHLGIDHEFLRPAATGAGDDGYVLAVGKDLARDYETLGRAAAGLDARVVVVTEERNVHGISLPPNVEVTRGLDYRELRELYARARCVALPVRRSDFPFGTESSGLTALLEAMAMAKPVVVSDRRIFGEYVRADDSALLVPPEDPAALRAALTRLLSDDALAERLGTTGRRLVEERFTMERFAAGLSNVLADLVVHRAEFRGWRRWSTSTSSRWGYPRS